MSLKRCLELTFKVFQELILIFSTLEFKIKRINCFMKKKQLLQVLAWSSVILFSCGGEDGDKDVSSAKTVEIGGKTWMAENLNISKFKNGDPIPQITDEAEWKKAGVDGSPAWCYYNNDPANGEKYGKLYNWYAVNDPRGLAPEGWHVPTDEEWNSIGDALGSKAGASMKSKAWVGGQGNGESGFEGMPGGNRNHDGSFHLLNSYGVFWTDTPAQGDYSWFRSLTSANAFLTRDYSNRSKGLSVRLVKD